MSLARDDIMLCVVMVASIVLVHVMGRYGFWAGLFPLSLILLPFVFAFPLCRAFLRGIASARDSMRDAVGESPVTVFRKELRPRFRIWFVLWAGYFVVLEVYLLTVAGGANLIVSIPSATMVLLMVTSCFIWAPRCKGLWPLVWLAFLTPPMAFVLVCVAAYALVDFLDMGGYMDIGLLTIPPLIASLFLVVAAIVTLIWVKRKGDAWFRV